MREQLTEISVKQWDFLLQEYLTAQEAVSFLQSGMQLRTFLDCLKTLYTEADLEKRLHKNIVRFYEYDGITGRRDSIRKKVQNWLCNKNLPTDREDVFRIAFALDLDENKTSLLLSHVFDQGIHYRNEKEIIYAFFLRNHQSYEDARECIENLAIRNYHPGDTSAPSTQFLKLEFEQLKPDEDILNFISKHSANLGKFHNTAYEYFEKMLNLLIDDADEENTYTIEYVADTYLRMNMPENKRTSSYDSIQKMVKKYWPGVKISVL